MIPWLPRLKSDVFISWADIWTLSVLGLFQVSIRCCVWGGGDMHSPSPVLSPQALSVPCPIVIRLDHSGIGGREKGAGRARGFIPQGPDSLWAQGSVAHRCLCHPAAPDPASAIPTLSFLGVPTGSPCCCVPHSGAGSIFVPLSGTVFSLSVPACFLCWGLIHRR